MMGSTTTWMGLSTRLATSLLVVSLGACHERTPTADPLTREDVTVVVRGVEFARFEGGSFTMGRRGVDFAEPLVQVAVAPFEIMRTEVTLGLYLTCVEDGACELPEYRDSSCLHRRPDAMEKLDHPINCLIWPDVQRFIEWFGHGARLPTEAEWEFAAGGGLGRWTPWGTSHFDCDHMVRFENQPVEEIAEGEERCLNMFQHKVTASVCSRPLGNTAEPHALCDMAGAGAELVADSWHPALDCSTYEPDLLDGTWGCNGDRVPADGSAWSVPGSPWSTYKGPHYYAMGPEIATREPGHKEMASPLSGLRVARDGSRDVTMSVEQQGPKLAVKILIAGRDASVSQYRVHDDVVPQSSGFATKPSTNF